MCFMHSSHTLFTQNIFLCFRCSRCLWLTLYPWLMNSSEKQFPHIQRVKELLKKHHWCALPLLSHLSPLGSWSTTCKTSTCRSATTTKSKSFLQSDRSLPLLPPFPISLTALCIKLGLNAPCSVRRRHVNLNKYIIFSNPHERCRPLQGPQTSVPRTACLVRLPR